MSVGAADPEPLSLEEMQELRSMQSKPADETLDVDRLFYLQAKMERALDAAKSLPSDTASIKKTPTKTAMDRFEEHGQYAWITTAVFLLAGMLTSNARWMCYWLALFSMRVQVTHSLFFDNGLTFSKFFAIFVIELVYPLLWSFAPASMQISTSMVFGTLGCALILWLLVLFATADRWHLTKIPPPRKKKRKTPRPNSKNKRPANKKQK